jgi:hypothetical protein
VGGGRRSDTFWKTEIADGAGEVEVGREAGDGYCGANEEGENVVGDFG